MVTAALVSFGLLLAAWIAAPDRARTRTASAPEVRTADLEPAEAAEPLAA